MIAARPLLGNFDQGFQYIQEFTGFITPGITVIFLLGLFWRPATETGALVAAATSVLLSGAMWWLMPDFPFMNRMLVVFLAALVLAVIVSLARPQAAAANRIETKGLDYKTSGSFNIFGLGVILILIALYATWW
jgi:SSS family solute:Na+ symporter